MRAESKTAKVCKPQPLLWCIKFRSWCVHFAVKPSPSQGAFIRAL